MKVHICAVGRIRSGPERALIDDYARRFDRTGRALSLGPLSEHEIDSRRAAGMEAEAAALRRLIPDGSLVCALDERGDRMSSPAFAERLAHWRDGGAPGIAFLIGGPDGLAPGIRDVAGAGLSLGSMVWPHALVRVMLAEQLYRAASILAGSPYHRE